MQKIIPRFDDQAQEAAPCMCQSSRTPRWAKLLITARAGLDPRGSRRRGSRRRTVGDRSGRWNDPGGASVGVHDQHLPRPIGQPHERADQRPVIIGKELACQNQVALEKECRPASQGQQGRRP